MCLLSMKGGVYYEVIVNLSGFGITWEAHPGHVFESISKQLYEDKTMHPEN